jgi:hypothetical protein
MGWGAAERILAVQPSSRPAGIGRIGSIGLVALDVGPDAEPAFELGSLQPRLLDDAPGAVGRRQL